MEKRAMKSIFPRPTAIAATATGALRLRGFARRRWDPGLDVEVTPAPSSCGGGHMAKYRHPVMKEAEYD